VLELEAALPYARHVVSECEELVVRVAGTEDTINKRLLTVAATSSMGEARGCLAALRIIFPGNEVLNQLWIRLNHCPVVMLAGPDPAPPKENQPYA
jgi:hypothetical protein